MLASTCVLACIPALVVLVGDTVPPLTLLTWRSVVAVAALYVVILAVRGDVGRLRGGQGRNARRAALLGFVVLGPDTVLYYVSFLYIDTAVAVAMCYIYPALVVLGLAAYRRARPSRPDMVLGFCALVGVGLLTLPGSGGSVSVLGTSLALTAAAGYAVYVIVAGQLSLAMDPLEMAMWVIAGSAAAALGPALLREGTPLPQGAGAWAIVIGQALLFVTALTTYYAGLRRVGAARASLLDTGQPLVAAVAGGLLLGERLIGLQLLGVAMIVGSVAGAAGLAMRSPSQVAPRSG